MNRPRRRKAPWEIVNDRVLKAVRESLDAGTSASAFQTGVPDRILLYKVGTALPGGFDQPSEKSADSVEPISYDDYDARKLLPMEQLQRDSQQTPLSTQDFMTRLSTYDILHWSRKPDCIASFHCARYGWQLCDDVSALVCVTCKKLIPTSKDCVYGMSSNEFNQQLRKGVEQSCHASSCPWKTHYSPVTILSLPQSFEMFHFVRDGVGSLLASSYPCLSSHYGKVMENLDLEWMKQLTGMDVTKNKYLHDSESATPSMMNQMIHFLVLNGWSMLATTIDDGISCNLCLRQVPLWVCKHPPAEEEILDLISPASSLPKATTNKCKEFDPVNNHWWWCPWRRFLEFSEAADLCENFSPEENASIFEHRFEESACLKEKAESKDYLRLKVLIEAECLKACCINKSQVLGPQLLFSVGNIMDEFISYNAISLNSDPCPSFADKADETSSCSLLRVTSSRTDLKMSDQVQIAGNDSASSRCIIHDDSVCAETSNETSSEPLLMSV